MFSNCIVLSDLLNTLFYWLRHYVTSLKVAGSSPGWGEFFNWPNSSSHSMALGSTEPLTEMSTRNLPGGGGKKRPVGRADILVAICEPNVWKMWKPQPLEILRASTTCTGITLPFTFTLALQLNAGLGRLHVTFRFTSATTCRSRTVGRTPWTGDQLVARHPVVHKHRKTHTQHKH
jgi:hypothetical protein